jgi:hypothetical protein
MGSFSINGTFSACYDPDMESWDGTPVVGAFVGGRPIRQGWPSCTLRFPPLPSAGFNELVSRYEANKSSQTSGNVPAVSGYGFRACSAYFEEPHLGGFDGGFALGVTMRVSRIGWY